MAMDKLMIEYLLVPSIITIIIVYLTAGNLMRGIGLKMHALISIMLYIVFVYSGLFGAFAPLMYNFAFLFILLGTGLFFVTRVISPSQMRTLGTVTSKLAEKQHDIKLIRNSARVKKEQIDDLTKTIEGMEGIMGPREYQVFQVLLHQARAELDILNSQIRDLNKTGSIASGQIFAQEEQNIQSTQANIEKVIFEIAENLKMDPNLAQNIAFQKKIARTLGMGAR